MTMEDFIDKQIERLGNQDYFNELSEGALEELRKAMWTAKSQESLAHVVTDWISGTSARPTPHDLLAAIRLEDERDQPSDAFRQMEQWKRESEKERRAGAMLLAAGVFKLKGVFARGRYPHLDAHMDLIIARCQEVKDNPEAARWHREEIEFKEKREHNYFRYETDARSRLRDANQKLGGEDCHMQQAHLRGVDKCECHDENGKPTAKPTSRILVQF